MPVSNAGRRTRNRSRPHALLLVHVRYELCLERREVIGDREVHRPAVTDAAAGWARAKAGIACLAPGSDQ